MKENIVTENTVTYNMTDNIVRGRTVTGNMMVRKVLAYNRDNTGIGGRITGNTVRDNTMLDNTVIFAIVTDNITRGNTVTNNTGKVTQLSSTVINFPKITTD